MPYYIWYSVPCRGLQIKFYRLFANSESIAVRFSKLVSCWFHQISAVYLHSYAEQVCVLSSLKPRWLQLFFLLLNRRIICLHTNTHYEMMSTHLGLSMADEWEQSMVNLHCRSVAPQSLILNTKNWCQTDDHLHRKSNLRNITKTTIPLNAPPEFSHFSVFQTSKSTKRHFTYWSK